MRLMSVSLSRLSVIKPIIGLIIIGVGKMEKYVLTYTMYVFWQLNIRALEDNQLSMSFVYF